MADGDPTGPDLATSTRSLNLGITETVYTFTLSSTYSIVSGTKYAIVLKAPSATVDDAVRWQIDSGVTGGGKLYVSTDSGSSWSQYGGGTQDAYVQTKAGGVVKDDLSFPSEASYYSAYGTRWLAQTFTAGSSYEIDQIAVKIRDNNPYVNPGQPVDVTLVLLATEGASAPSKASNPSPADAAGPGIDFSGDENNPPTLSWTGDGDSYNVYGGGGGSFVKIAEGIATTSYTLSAADMNTFKCGSSVTPVQWRVDSINDQGTTTGDTWTFDPRPAKVTTPSPSDTATGQSIYQLMGWAASTYADDYDVWWEGSEIYTATESVSVLPLVGDLPMSYGTEITWRVDANNYYGTVEGDEWTFTTLTWDPPHVTVRSLATGEVVAGPFDPLTMYITGENFTAGMRRLLVFCGSSMWYESVDKADS